MDNQLKATMRDSNGKGPARRVRMTGRIPGVFYYQGQANVVFSVEHKEFLQLLKSKPSLIMLEVEGGESRECIIRELQRDPVTEKILHIDLLGIKRGQKLRVDVKVKLTGTPIGVKTGGGILQQGSTILEVECFPKDIPSEILFDVSELKVGDSVHVRDLDYPELKFMTDLSVVVAQVIEPVISRTSEELETEADQEEEAEEEKPEK